MKATKIAVSRGILPLAGLLIGLLVSCTPPGPAALLDGESLLKEGEYQAAVKRLREATDLLGDHPEAWNFLGLAYHKAGDAESAVKAYKKALDLNVDLVAARYNYACLLLENGEYGAAEDQFKTYEIMVENEGGIRAKIGVAQLGDGRLAEAKASFESALQENRKQPEAWNGLGQIHLQRDLVRQAEEHFETAIDQDENYGPAYLNLAVLAHRDFRDLRRALQYYRRYLFLEPNASNATEIKALTEEIELALRPKPVEVVQTPEVPEEVPPEESETTVVVVQDATPDPTEENESANTEGEKVEGSVEAEPEPSTLVARTEKTQEDQRPETPAPEKVTGEQEGTNPKEKVEQTLVKVETPLKNTIDPAGTETTQEEPSESGIASTVTFEKVEVADNEYNFAVADNQPENLSTENESDTGWRTVSTRRSGLGISVGRSLFQSPGENTKTSTRTGRVQRQASVPYEYRSPQRPTRGNRLDADPFFLQGNEAFKAGRASDAILAYREALSRDPAFFAAHYNMGLAAIKSGQSATALEAYELALTLDPKNRNARYNFALALEQGRHFEAAADELRRVLADHPDDVNAHFTLASLFAKKMGDAALARKHYLEVLSLNPSFPEAVSIRYWLSAAD